MIMASAFEWTDPFLFEKQLSADERAQCAQAAAYARDCLAPRVGEWLRSARSDPSIFREMGARGFFGAAIGAGPAGYVGAGLIAREIERIDSGYRAMLTAQTSLVMLPLRRFGSQAQRDRFLPLLANGKAVGCFGLFEPHGATPVLARRSGSGYVLSGVKGAVTNSPVANLFMVWALDEDREMRGFMLEKGMRGLSAPVIRGQVGLRTTTTGQIVMQDVYCPVQNVLPGVSGMAGPLACLHAARYTIACGVLGAAEACWHAAERYARGERRFGRVLAVEPRARARLDEMQADIALTLQGCLRAGRMMEQGSGTEQTVAMLKRHACTRAVAAARSAQALVGRDGDPGALVKRHLANLELVEGFERSRSQVLEPDPAMAAPG